MDFKKVLSALLALCLVFCLLPAAAFAEGEQTSTGSFTAASMNVDGLPQKIFVVEINSDGPGSEGTKKISAKLNEMQWDIIGVSEDFNYNTELLSSLSNYNSGTHRGGISGVSNKTDGLNLLWKNSIRVSGEKWTSWDTYYSTGPFGSGNGADGMIDKGYRYYQATVAEGVSIDVYILHMDADSDPKDIAARESQLTQLANAIRGSNNGNPIIVMGDTNCRYTRENLKTLFIDAINADSRFTIQDAWIEKVRGGDYPVYGSDALVATDKGGTYPHPQAEIVDKLFYINNTDSNVTLTADSYSVVTSFTDTDGTALADHWPILVNFSYTLSNPTGEHTHSYVLTAETPATCTEDGSRTYTCSGCNDSYTETITANGHSYAITAETAATCTEDGSRTYTCSACNDSYIETITANGHSYVLTAETPATCTDDGLKTYTCSACNDSYTETITANGHSYVLTAETAATCTEAGSRTYTCSACSDSYTETITANGHSYVLTAETAATCAEAGSRTYTCSACNDSYTETITALGHSYADGVCTRCGQTDSSQPTDPQEPEQGETLYTLGQPVTEIISGEKYALVFPGSTAYSLNHSESGKISAGYFTLAEGDQIADDLVWTLTEAKGGYTISTELDGQTKYLARTKTLTNGGFKIVLQDNAFVWTFKANESAGTVRFSAKVVTNYYALRYYTARTGWIAAARVADIQIYQLNG